MARKWGPYAVAALWVYLLVWPHVASLSNWNTNIWPLADHTSTVMWVLKEGYTELWSATVERALAAGVTPPTTAGLAKLEIYPSFSAIYEIDVALSNSATHYIDLQAVGTNVETYLATAVTGVYPRTIPTYTFSSCWAQAGNTNVLGDDYGWPQRYGLDARRRVLNRMRWTTNAVAWESVYPATSAFVWTTNTMTSNPHGYYEAYSRQYWTNSIGSSPAFDTNGYYTSGVDVDCAADLVACIETGSTTNAQSPVWVFDAPLDDPAMVACRKIINNSTYDFTYDETFYDWLCTDPPPAYPTGTVTYWELGGSDADQYWHDLWVTGRVYTWATSSTLGVQGMYTGVAATVELYAQWYRSSYEYTGSWWGCTWSSANFLELFTNHATLVVSSNKIAGTDSVWHVTDFASGDVMSAVSLQMCSTNWTETDTTNIYDETWLETNLCTVSEVHDYESNTEHETVGWIGYGYAPIDAGLDWDVAVVKWSFTYTE